ncbi:ATP-binding cassette domain-containing protein [Adlercreutzia sp. R7]|uniref:ATP-binding cassette domain-containing protein n=1 Tax=Adlercreutzia wanghongyangiae TaxID=3111451 RepID=A0ABU6IG34_9ACTN|nr:ATP-binding cassette domain-containing protein [Adlercreutzia sp. R7]
MALLALEHLTFTYPGAARAALNDVSLDFAPGSYTVVAGLSGCGKTTLLRCLKPPLAPAGERAGAVRWNGVPLEGLSSRDQACGIGFVMQEPDAQIVCDRVEAELAFGLENVGCAREMMGLRVAEMTSFFGIGPWLHQSTLSLSGGQKQLLNLASVMAAGPEVLVLDEPTSQLDPIAAADFLAAVRRVNRELGVTVIMAEHCLEEALADADTLVVLEKGRVIETGDPRMVAAQVASSGSPLATALPAALRVHAAVSAEEDALSAPLTVAEGRRWLEKWAQNAGARTVAHGAVAAGDDAAAGCAVAGAPLPAACQGSADAALAARLRDVRFRYGRDRADVLRGLSLGVPAGAVTALVGANGAGKSTVLKVLAGLVRPYQGSVEVLGRRLGALRRPAAMPVALLPQDPTLLFSRETVRAELEEMSGDAALVARMAARCEVDGLLDAHPLDLSGGERQRVALAKVLIARPRLLLLDEPTKGLDAAAKASLGALLADLAAEGTTVVVASHDLDFCAAWSRCVALVFDGVVAACAAPREIFAAASFYTTAASRVARDVFPGAVTVEDVIACCRSVQVADYDGDGRPRGDAQPSRSALGGVAQ